MVDSYTGFQARSLIFPCKCALTEEQIKIEIYFQMEEWI